MNLRHILTNLKLEYNYDNLSTWKNGNKQVYHAILNTLSNELFDVYSDNDSLLFKIPSLNYVATQTKKNQRKSHYNFCSTPGIVLNDKPMEVVKLALKDCFLLYSWIGKNKNLIWTKLNLIK